MNERSSAPQLKVTATKEFPGSARLLQRQCACDQHTQADEECEECRKKHEGALQRAAVNNTSVSVVPPIVHKVLNAPGQTLEAETRALVEPRFGYDFSQVRVRTDAKAAESARAVNALAYTAGRDVVFGVEQYAPGMIYGRKLLAHELTHVMQQQGQSHLNQGLIQRKPASTEATNHTAWDDLPADARQAIDKTYFNEELKPEAQSAFKAVYSALVTAGLWDQVIHVYNAYPENVRGIEAIAKTSLTGRLASDVRFCRDTQTGGSKHPGVGMWRQVVQAGTEGLHVGVSKEGRMLAHLDTLAPVDGRESNAECRYSMPHILPHVQRDLKGWRNLEFLPAPTRETKPGDVQPDIRISIPGT